MFSKNKVSQSMIDAVNQVVETAPIKEPTPTGMRVFGGSYGNSAKAKQDQTKKDIDNLKGPKAKEMKEAAKPDFLDMDKDGNKKEPMKKAIADKSVKEELKGDQHKIDANHNNKIDGQDFKILKGKKKVSEGMHFAGKLLEAVRKSDVPAYLRKAKGDTPLTMADVKAPKKDSISAPENLAKARNEEVELSEVSLKTATSAYVKRAGEDDSTSQLKAVKTISHIANRYGVKGVARAAKNADMEYGLNDPVHNKRKDFVKGVMSGVKEEVELDEENYKQCDDVPITTDTLAGRMPGGKINSFKSYKLKVSPLDKEGERKPDDDTPEAVKIQKTPAMKSHEVHEATIAGTSGWEPMKKDAKDKSGAVHTPMSRARDLAKSALKRVQDKTKIK